MWIYYIIASVVVILGFWYYGEHSKHGYQDKTGFHVGEPTADDDVE